MPTQRKEPNRLDPLSEPTLNRRLWAARLQRGLTRAAFARAIGVSRYATVDDWDLGKTVPQLDALMRASVVLGLSLDELCFGRRQRRSPKLPEVELSRDQIKSLLRELRASRDQVEALAEHERSAAGHYQSLTRSYVATFVVTFAAELKKSDREAAIAKAIDAAINARMLAEAVAAGAGTKVQPFAEGELAAMGAELMVEHGAAKAASPARVVTAEADPRPALAGKRKKSTRRRQRA